MTTAAANTIKIKGPDGAVQERLIASGQTIKPGMLVKVTSAGEWTVHSTSGGSGARWIVLEDSYQGDSTTGGGTNQAYTAQTPCEAEAVLPGALRYVLLKASENVAIGDLLISGGDGSLIKTTGTPTQTFAVAEEASNVGTAQLIKARFL